MLGYNLFGRRIKIRYVPKILLQLDVWQVLFSQLTLILQELEQIEDHYKQETRDLLNTVKRLQDENRKLANSLVAANERDSAFSEDGKWNMIVKI